jgi:outer membrane protein OmpA-like peptidoglycan-associated protein
MSTSSLSHRVVAALVGAGVAFLVPSLARAQFAERLSLGFEGAVGTYLLEPQSNEYGFGYAFGGRGTLRIAGPFGMHVFGNRWAWRSSDAQLQTGVLVAFGGGVRIDPMVGRVGRFVADLDVGVVFTGSDNTTRATGLVLGGGIGWLFPLASVLSLGPIARIHYLTNLGSASGGDRDGALFWSAGLSVTLHGARSEAPRRITESDLEGSGGGTVTAGMRRPRASEDTDRDGIVDTDDRCVTEPETRNGYLDEDGCPDTPPDPNDPDHDMVSGAADQCPNEAEDFDGFEDADGCPEVDNDRDGVPDAQDQCADQAETRNRYQDDDGCADENPNPEAIVDGTRITLTQAVTFSGRDVRESSRTLLDAVVRELNAHPEILRIRVECRSDEGGNDRRNVRESTQCARAVVRYIRRAGIAKRRVTALGAGSLNATGNAPRTRVDIVIIDPAGGVGGGAGATAPTPIATPVGAPTTTPPHEAGGEEGGRHRRRRHRRH